MSEQVERFFDEGVNRKAKYMLLLYDFVNGVDYPVYVSPEEDIHAVILYWRRSPMQKLMSVYDLTLDKTEQLARGRVFNIPKKDDTTI
jgi:hypothetical protein